MTRLIIHFILFLFISNALFGQELNVKVEVKAPTLSFADPKVTKTLENGISEFFNNNKWTEEDFEDDERIEVNFTLYITEDLSPTSFTADIRFQTLRPVYNSNYVTPILNISDKSYNFTYQELQPIQNNEFSYTDNLSSLMTFYAYLILGYDFDTFSAQGGEKYFRKAQEVLNNIPPSEGANNEGWTNESENGRYFMIETLFNPRSTEMRQMSYDYHRQGLDIMHQDQNKALAVMTSALTSVDRVNKAYPNSLIVQMFTDAKNEELIEVFRGASEGQKAKVQDILISVDPSRADRYYNISKF